MDVGFVLGARAWIVKMFKKDMELQRKFGAPNAIGNFHESIFNPNGFRDKKMLCDKIKIYVNTLNVMLFIFKTKNWLL